jgi:hypothetical protein
MSSTANTPLPSRQESVAEKSIADAPAHAVDLEKRNPKRRHLLGAYDAFLAAVLVANLALMAHCLATTAWRSAGPLPLDQAIVASAANTLAAILVRQEYAVNLAYAGVLRIPHALPLRLRSALVRVYEHGGVHAGCGVAGALWYFAFVAAYTVEFSRGRVRSVSVMVASYALLLLLATIVVFAQQRLRFKRHDVFELTHRFAGWTAVALFWVDLVTYAAVPKYTAVPHSAGVQQVNLSTELLHAPAFWLLLLTTVHLVLPWLRLRRMAFSPTVLSASALRLDFDAPWPLVTGIALSVSPLREWHPFATFPTPSTSSDGGRSTQYSVLISRAGDWTAAQIAAPRYAYWVRGWPRAGLLQLALAFRSVVIVTTGAGIGPALSLLLVDRTRWPRRARTACRLVWCAARPRATLGQEVCDAVARADPRAVVIDSRAGAGRPDLLAVAYAAWREEGAEAVFVISNRGLTRMVVEGLEGMGVHAFGPIWDS